jgi:hypothetical protein
MEIDIKEDKEFNEELKEFVEWLKNDEKILRSLKNVYSVMEKIRGKIEEKKELKKDVGVNREKMINMDKKGKKMK